MKVFITGSTGYIGFNVALAFRSAGYDVWGLVHNKAKAHKLIKNGIHPVIGSMEAPDEYSEAAANCSILVHASADYKNFEPLDRKTVQTLLGLGNRGACPKTVIYTSGVWVHGHTGCAVVDETMPLSPPEIVSHRPDLEKTVLGAQGIKGIVIRPGNVYGKQGGLTGMWFNGAHNEHSLTAVGDGSNHWATVHVEDLSRAYLLAAESGLGQEVFNICSPYSLTVNDMATAAACATSYTGDIRFIPTQEAAGKMGGMAHCLALDQHMESRKAQNLLGWRHLHLSFTDEAGLHFESWKAYQQETGKEKAYL
ncbi:MAG: NAD-dependent epimerase/dehydratase family protein [Nitrospiraceae bacterium]|nr:NAD-dependent epimerase/dehydratase family protein [Nitrospiraceae bacterium]